MADEETTPVQVPAVEAEQPAVEVQDEVKLPPVAVADIQRVRADLDQALGRVEADFEKLDHEAVAKVHAYASDLRAFLKHVHL